MNNTDIDNDELIGVIANIPLFSLKDLYKSSITQREIKELFEHIKNPMISDILGIEDDRNISNFFNASRLAKAKKAYGTPFNPYWKKAE